MLQKFREYPPEDHSHQSKKRADHRGPDLRPDWHFLTELIAQNTAESRQAILIPEFVRAAEKYLEQHFREKVPLHDLADMLHVDRFYLIKEFGRYVGISIRRLMKLPMPAA